MRSQRYSGTMSIMETAMAGGISTHRCPACGHGGQLSGEAGIPRMGYGLLLHGKVRRGRCPDGSRDRDAGKGRRGCNPGCI